MLEKELEKLIIKKKDVIPFLKKLTAQDKRQLVPFLKKLHKKINEVRYEQKREKWGVSYYSIRPYSEKHRDLIDKACFVCFNKTDIKKVLYNASNLAVSDDYLKNIIPWYYPKWYNDVINERIPWGLSYEKMMRLSKQGLIECSRNMIVDKLPRAIIESKYEGGKYISKYRPEILTEHKETLEQHIWLLFDEESSINNYYHYSHLNNHKGGNHTWIDTILDLVNDGLLDRKKILIAIIYTSTKNFNKILGGWFFDMLIKFAPTDEEILDLQNELFAALNSPHSKVVNTILKYFKQVIGYKTFNYDTFIENASLLLLADTKSIVNTTLMILEKIARTHQKTQNTVCQKVTEALMNLDEKIQLRASKIIERFGNKNEQVLIKSINIYAENLFHSSKTLLKDYISLNEEITELEFETSLRHLKREDSLPKLSTLDDMIFFVSQAIDNNETFHIDLLLSYLPKLNLLLSKENVSRLTPIFKRCLNLSMSYDWNSQIGNLEKEAAHYIHDFATILMQRYPQALQDYRNYKNKKLTKNNHEKYLWKREKEIENRKLPNHIYLIYRTLFIKSKILIKKGLDLELLSTPTHAPCWIEPNILLERIIAFENNNEEIELYDFQMAMSRLLKRDYDDTIIKKIEKIKDTEVREVLKYHFDFIDIKNTNITRPEIILQSVLCKNKDCDIEYFHEYTCNPLYKERGLYNWDCYKKEHRYKEYDYTLKKQVEKTMMKKQLRYDGLGNSQPSTISYIGQIKNIFYKKKSTGKLTSIYNEIHFRKERYLSFIQPHDDVKFLFISPNNPSMYLSQVIYSILKESTFYDETSKKNMVNLLKGLHSLWGRSDYGEPTYLFLAAGLLCSHKVARELAAEIWIKANTIGEMDNVVLGNTLGKLQFGEYAPMKRFTDLISTNLFNISKAHNKALLILLDRMIGQMNEAPLKGLNKLLEIFLELKYKYLDFELSNSSKQILKKWNEKKSLRPKVASLLE